MFVLCLLLGYFFRFCDAYHFHVHPKNAESNLAHHLPALTSGTITSFPHKSVHVVTRGRNVTELLSPTVPAGCTSHSPLRNLSIVQVGKPSMNVGDTLT